MEKCRDRIVKYLADQMSDNERILFENELNQSSEMLNEMNLIKQRLSDFRVNDSIAEENYFVNLIPKVKERINYRKRYAKIKRSIIFAAPTFASILLVVMFLTGKSGSLENYSKEIANEVIANLADEKVSNNYLSMTDFETHSVTTQDNIKSLSDVKLDENSKERILSRYDSPIYEDLKSISELSDSEIESIYSRVSLKKE